MEKKRWKWRVKELRRAKAEELREHPLQIKSHGERQRELFAGVLREVGIAGALVAYESRKYGGLVLIDGHLRREMGGEWPVVILDVSDEEAEKLLLTFDTVGQMGEVLPERLEVLGEAIWEGIGERAFRELVEEILPEKEEEEDWGGVVEMGERERGEVTITPEVHERHDYVLLYCENQMDWEALCTWLEVGPVRNIPLEGSTLGTKRGIGRVVPAKRFLRLVGEMEEERQRLEAEVQRLRRGKGEGKKK